MTNTALNFGNTKIAKQIKIPTIMWFTFQREQRDNERKKQRNKESKYTMSGVFSTCGKKQSMVGRARSVCSLHDLERSQ